MTTILEIPLKETPGEVVEVDLSDIASLNPDELIDLLTDEQAPLSLYRHVALAYYRQGSREAFERICLVALERVPGANHANSTNSEEASEYFMIGAALVAWYLQKEHQLDQATALINKLERIEAQLRATLSLSSSLPSLQALGLCRGVLLLLRRQGHDLAESQFKAVLGASPASIPARIGMAVSLFARGNFGEALVQFQGILREWPRVPIRLAIGHCLARLGLVEPARRAYEWILQKEGPACLEALVALGTLLMNAASLRNTEMYLPAALKTFKRLYELDKTNPYALNHLGNHFFFKKDYSKASALLQSAASPIVMAAENAYYLGKLAHLQEQYETAESHYLRAVTLDPQMVMAQFGLGQMYLHRGDRRNALECFQRVLAREKESQAKDAFSQSRLLVGLLMTSVQIIEAPTEDFGKNLGKAEALLRGSLAASEPPQVRIDILRALAVLLETKAIDPSSSMLGEPLRMAELTGLYQQIRQLNEVRFGRSLDLLNNLGVLEGSEQYLREALGLSPQHGTVRFNLARLQESQGKLSEAEEVYRQLLLDPAASNLASSCHLRLGLCALARGGAAAAGEAADHFSEAIGLDETDVAAWTLMARSHHLQRALTPARKAYERVLVRHDRHDGYALVALGNIYLDIWRSERQKTPGQKSAEPQHLDRAAEFYIKALQVCPSNAYAANGLGVVAAERGDFGKARQIFQHVSIALPAFRDALVNLAHCFVEAGQWSAALHAYQQSAETGSGGGGKDAVTVQLYLARCMYLQGRQEHQWKNFEMAISALDRAIALLPRDLPLRYNVGLCWQEMATLQMRQFERDIKGGKIAAAVLSDEATADEEGGKALRALDEAQAIFGKLKLDLQTPKSSNNPGVSSDQLEHRLKHSAQLRTSLLALIETATAQAAARSGQISRLREERAKAQQLQAERNRLEAERLAQERATSEQISQEMSQRMRQLEERFKEQLVPESSGSSNRQAAFINDSDDENSAAEYDQSVSASSSSDHEMKDSSPDDGDKPKRRRSNTVNDQSPNQSTTRKQRRNPKRKSTANTFSLSKETISSSEDEQTGNETSVVKNAKKTPLISIEDEE